MSLPCIKVAFEYIGGLHEECDHADFWGREVPLLVAGCGANYVDVGVCDCEPLRLAAAVRGVVAMFGAAFAGSFQKQV